MAKNTRRRASGSNTQNRAVGMLDDLAEFNQYREEILPVLRQALKAGTDAETIYKKFQAYAAARMVSIAATEIDSAKALSAIKDILDRTQGKAKERQEVTHRLSSLPEEQLDAILLSKLKDQQEGDEDDQPKH